MMPFVRLVVIGGSTLAWGALLRAPDRGSGGVRPNVYGAGRRADCVPPPDDGRDLIGETVGR